MDAKERYNYLYQNGFYCDHQLWHGPRGRFQPFPAVYAFVAPNGIVLPRSTSWDLIDPGSNIEAGDVFYVGSTDNLASRMANHRKKALAFDWSKPHKGTHLAMLLCEARHKAPVEVWINSLPNEIFYHETRYYRLPVDLLRGVERGLIRELQPRANSR